MIKLRFLFVLLTMFSLASLGFEEGKNIDNEIKSESSAEYYDADSNNSDAKFLTAFSCKEYREHYLIATLLGLMLATCIIFIEKVNWYGQNLLPRNNKLKLKDIFRELKLWKNCSKRLRHSAIICCIALFILAGIFIALLFPKIFVDDVNNELFHNTMGVLIPLGITIFAFGIYILTRKDDQYTKTGKIIRILRVIIIMLYFTMTFVINSYDLDDLKSKGNLFGVFLVILFGLTITLNNWKKIKKDNDINVIE